MMCSVCALAQVGGSLHSVAWRHFVPLVAATSVARSSQQTPIPAFALRFAQGEGARRGGHFEVSRQGAEALPYNGGGQCRCGATRFAGLPSPRNHSYTSHRCSSVMKCTEQC